MTRTAPSFTGLCIGLLCEGNRDLSRVARVVDQFKHVRRFGTPIGDLNDPGEHLRGDVASLHMGAFINCYGNEFLSLF